jgi:hypothetical protein
VNDTEEDAMTSTSTFFIETACVAGISPLDADAVTRQLRVRPRTAAAPEKPRGFDDAFVEELLATFTDRWEW